MKILLPFILINLSVLTLFGMSPTGDSTRIEVLLTSQLAKETGREIKFTPSLEITSGNLVLLSDKEQFYLLGWGGIVTVGKKPGMPLSAFAYTFDSLLMVISDRELCITDTDGELQKLFSLPSAGMGITKGKYLMFLYERDASLPKHALFAMGRGGKFSKLFEVPEPINSVTEYNNSIWFASGKAVYRFNPADNKISAEAIVNGSSNIRSVEIDRNNGRIYFSTNDMTGTIDNGKPVIITEKLGGELRWMNGLIVFNPEKQMLIRISGIDAAIADSKSMSGNRKPVAMPPAAEPETLTNASIISMVKNNIPDEEIISKINRSPVRFNLSVDSMVDLSSQGVSSAVIMAMKKANNSQPSK